MSLSDREQRELERLVGLYKQLPRAEPPAALDRAILAKAQAAVAQPRALRWSRSLATAAVLALAVGVGWQLRERDDASEREAMSRSAPAPAAREAAPAPARDTAPGASPSASTMTSDSEQDAAANEAVRADDGFVADAVERGASAGAEAKKERLVEHEAQEQLGQGLAKQDGDAPDLRQQQVETGADRGASAAMAETPVESSATPARALSRSAPEEPAEPPLATATEAQPLAGTRAPDTTNEPVPLADAPAPAAPKPQSSFRQKLAEPVPEPLAEPFPETAASAPPMAEKVAPAPANDDEGFDYAPAEAPAAAPPSPPPPALAAPATAPVSADTSTNDAGGPVGRVDEAKDEATAPHKRAATGALGITGGTRAEESRRQREGTAPADAVRDNAAGAAAAPTLDRSTPERWLAGIRVLIERNDIAQARRELERLRRRFPRADIPDDIVDRLR